MSDETPYQLFYLLYNPRTLLRYFTSVAILGVLTLLVLGIAFMQLAFGIAVSFLLLAGFWAPANKVFVRLARLPDPVGPFTPLPAPGWFLAFLVAQVLIVCGLFIFSSIWLLVEKGFWGQNLFYTLFING